MAFLIIYLISLFFDDFLAIAIVAKAFKGIKVAVGILIARAALNLWKKTNSQLTGKKIQARISVI